MLSLFLLRLKSAGRHGAAFILLLACQITFSYLSAYALSERPPVLRLALLCEQEDRLAAEFSDLLARATGLELILVADRAEAEKLLQDQQALALAIVPEDFAGRVAAGGSRAVTLISGPGAQSLEQLSEYLHAALLQLIANQRLNQELDKLSGNPGSQVSLPEHYQQVLTIEYQGPPTQQGSFRLLPAYGIPSLFLLLTALYASQTLPGKESRRLFIQGRRALRDLAAGLAATLVIWGMLLAAYLLSVTWLYDAGPGLPAKLALCGLIVYSAGLGCLLSAAAPRVLAVWVFLPWLLANMTLGGGLWGLGIELEYAKPLLPLLYVAAAWEGSVTNAAALFLWGLLFMLAGGLLINLHAARPQGKLLRKRRS